LLLLHKLVEGSSPSRPSGNLGTVSIDLLPVMLTETSVKVNLVNGKPLGSLPEVTDDPEDKDDGNSKASHEEVLGVTVSLLEGGADGDVELAAENDKAEGKTQPRTVDTTSSMERDLVESAALTLPSRAETDVALTLRVSVDVYKINVIKLTAQMEPQVKRAARAETARSQSKTRPPEEARTM
jgi:hypothetical protein